ncbi:hypothetical protein BU26DRAFT_523938 [Trematosphaeria pertusa]|uniref:N-acetyltransferase domain-containing protein n=1 Tax=Trematosphaeria pertusa TaxID=390896 RepID=A0A6A6HXL8_9PLEO|nr:uncharacterized protein BU26DRAFT_523938 [Trematosphaeria pertusa]KAF2242954.1 hypothetical protein BU26DRAFT_523938 [Trematosphaeria pertusa]
MASAASTTSQYRIVRIPPDSPRLVDLVAKFRDTKLAALEAEPGGFAVKHADEILHSIEIWQRRLAPPSNVFICVVAPESAAATDDERALILGDWVGMATIRGPLPYSTYHIPASGQPIPEDPDRETRWHLCNLYTSSAHRGQGLAKTLVHACVDFAAQQTRTDEKARARIRLFFNPAKTFLMVMYKALGFQEAGMITLKEAFVANGDEELIPEDTRSSDELWWLWERRYGMAMERVVDVV